MYKDAPGYRPTQLDLSPFGAGFVTAVAGRREPSTIERELAAIERREADRQLDAQATQPARGLRARLAKRRSGR